MRNLPAGLALLPGLAIALLLVGGLPIQPRPLALAAPLVAPIPVTESTAAFDPADLNLPGDAVSVPLVTTVATATVSPTVSNVDGVATAIASDSLDTSPRPGAAVSFPNTPAPAQDHRVRAPPPGGVPILMYHYVRINPVATDAEGFNLSVTPDNFRLQMRFLRTHGFSPVSMADVREFVRNRLPLPAKPIAITFDDGYADAYTEALPTLKRFQLTGTFYIVTGFIDRSQYLTWQQVTKLESDGMEIASHTVHHRSLTLLGALQRQAELDDSRSELERRLGHAVLDFCYPNGQIDVASELAVARAGYQSATTTAFGRAAVGDDPMRLPRIRVWGGESLLTFAERLGEAPNSSDIQPIDRPN